MKSLPILMQESFWWWQCSDRCIISFFPHLHTPSPPPFSPSLINLMVSVDVKHHVYLLLLKQIVFGFVFCLILFYAFVCLFFCLYSLVSINFSCRLKRNSSVLLSVCTHAHEHKHTNAHTEPLWVLGGGGGGCVHRTDANKRNSCYCKHIFL